MSGGSCLQWIRNHFYKQFLTPIGKSRSILATLMPAGELIEIKTNLS